MSATNTTPHYELPSFLATDKPAWLVDWNGAMAKIDAGIYQAQQSADHSGTDITALSQSLTTLSGTVDSQGLTISTLSQSLTTAIGNINTINSLIGNGTPTTTDQTIIGAINEINARTGEAEGISYDNTDSGLSATNVQGAIDELETEISVKTEVKKLTITNASPDTVEGRVSIPLTDISSSNTIVGLSGHNYKGMLVPYQTFEGQWFIQFVSIGETPPRLLARTAGGTFTIDIYYI